MPLSSIKDHILEPGEDWMRCAQGRKRGILSGFLRWGFLCQLLHNGNKMEVIDVVRDAVSDKKMILTEKKKKTTSLKASCFKILVTFSKEDWVQWRVPRNFQVPTIWSSHVYCPIPWGDLGPSDTTSSVDSDIVFNEVRAPISSSASLYLLCPKIQSRALHKAKLRRAEPGLYPEARYSGPALSHYARMSLRTMCHMWATTTARETKGQNSCLKANVTSLAPMEIKYREHLDYRKK